MRWQPVARLAFAAALCACGFDARAVQPWGTDSPASDQPAVRRTQPPDQGGVPGAVGFPQFPSLSPDGRRIVFAWAGDLWMAPVQPAARVFATRLTSHPAEERRSAFSPDGRWLAFESSREGARNIYVAPIHDAGGGVAVLGPAVRITVSDQPQGLGSFAHDGSAIYFASTRDPSMHRAARMFRVELRFNGGSVAGGSVSRLSDAFGSSPRAAGADHLLFVRNSAPLERPRYHGSGQTDVYALNTTTGAFTRLTSEPCTDADPWARPDGSVVFISSRDGQNNVWMLPSLSGGNAVQLTRFAPSAEQVSLGHGVRDLAVAGDGRTCAFCIWDTLYTLDLTDRGAKPAALDIRAAADSPVLDFQPRDLDREISEQALSPDGKTLAVVARGEIFVRSTQEGFPTRRVTDTPGRERDLAWSPDGRVLYFASDDPGLAAAAGATSPEGIYGIYAASVALAREDLAADKPSEAEARTVEARPEAPPRQEGEPVPVPPPSDPPPTAGAGAEPDAPPPAETPASSERPKAEKKPARPDHGKRWSESLRYAIEAVVPPGKEDARTPLPSPDGRKLLYTRHRGDLVLRELAGGEERVLLESWDEPESQWASDSRHLVYAVSDLDYNSDIWLLDTQPDPESGAAARPVNLTRHPDTDSSPRLSHDGKVLTFLSERGGDNGEFDIYQIYLDKSLESMTAYERDDYFKKAGEAAGKLKPLGAGDRKDADKDRKADDKPGEDKPADKPEKKDEAKAEPKPLKFDASDAYLRVRRVLSMPGPEGTLAVTPGADRIIFSASGDPERSLHSCDHKGGDRKVLQAGAVSGVGVSLTGDKVVFSRQGQVYATPPKGGGKVDGLPISAPVVIDIARQQRQKFLEAAKLLGNGFYHQTLKGLDWPALTGRYLDLVQRTRTNEEFNRVTLMLFSELDGSHLGISGGSPLAAGVSASSPAIGYLGAFTEPAPGGFRVTRVHRNTPADAALPARRLNPGDLIVAVDGRRLAPDDGSMPTLDLDAAMRGTVGKEVLIDIRRSAPGAAPTGEPAAPAAPATAREQTVLIIPISASAWDDAQYWDEVEERRRRVEELSNGRLGYLHVRAMGEASVRDFERDLYAAAAGKDGLIIDVRDNGGGWTADILLASLTAPRHAWTAPRGVDPASIPKDAYPRDRRLIYAWTRPISVLINQNSFSNAEIFAHAIKTIGRGRLVGIATFGGVISTGSASLIDGASVRMPGRGWFLPDGTDMENNGARPDIEVPQTPEDEAAGRDPQLEAAVTDLLAQIDAGAATR